MEIFNIPIFLGKRRIQVLRVSKVGLMGSSGWPLFGETSFLDLFGEGCLVVAAASGDLVLFWRGAVSK